MRPERHAQRDAEGIPLSPPQKPPQGGFCLAGYFGLEVLDGLGAQKGEDIALDLAGAVGPHGVVQAVHGVEQGGVLTIDVLVADPQVVREFGKWPRYLRSAYGSRVIHLVPNNRRWFVHLRPVGVCSGPWNRLMPYARTTTAAQPMRLYQRKEMLVYRKQSSTPASARRAA